MSDLNDKRVEFMRCVALLVLWANENNLPVIGRELERTASQAALYVKSGAGIANSLHMKMLAIDLHRVKDGKITLDGSDYKALADHWITLHPLARAGYFFKRMDAYHFSFEHEGVK